MKIRKLHINRFGHFSERGLEFSGNGLQVIYGPNEAGKTTLLEFLRGVLFDFRARTPYDFGGGGDLAGVATLEMLDGRRVELRRRKGHRDKVNIQINGEPTDLDDAGWFKLLDHADRTLFESVFAFGIDQLSQGEESLKHESLQSALIGGGLGSVSSPDKVITELGRQADELFKKAGKIPRINVLVADLKRTATTLKERSLRPESYHRAVEEADKAIANAKALHTQVDALRREHSQIEKRVRAWPKWWELQQRRDERAELGNVPPLPADARLEYVDFCNELKTLGASRAKHTAEIELVDRNLATLQLNPEAVSYAGDIQSCVELRQSFIEARDQLPERRQKRESLRLEIDRELHETRPGWSYSELRAFTVDLATSTEIQRLSEACRDRLTKRTTLSAKRDSDQENLDRSRQELDAICEASDISILAGLLDDEAEYVAERKQFERIHTDLKKMQGKLATQILQLTPPLSREAIAPQELPVPRGETVAEFKKRQAELAELLRAANTSADQVESERRQLEKSLAKALKSGGVPSLEERDDARTRRDEGWELVRRQFINGESIDSRIAAWLGTGTDAALPDEYVHAVKQADRIADRIYDNANEVAEREGLRCSLVDIESRLTEKRQLITSLQSQQDKLQAEWTDLWQTCGLEPLAPEAMQSWLKKHETVCSTVAECDDLTAELTSLGERVDAFEQRLSVACDEAVEDASSMLASVRQTVADEKHRQERLKNLQKEVRRLEAQLDKYDKELQSIQGIEEAANAEWRVMLDRLKLPVEWDAELTRTVIDKLKTTRVRLDSLPGEDDRIAAMESRIDEFNCRICKLCEVLAPELLRIPAELAINKLDEQVEHAVEAKRKHDEFSQKLADLRNALESSGERLQQVEVARNRLFASVAVTNEAEFLEVVKRNEMADGLDRDITQLRREIDLIRAGDDSIEFEHALSTSELSMLQDRERELKVEVNAADTSRRKADGDVAIAREALSRLDGSDEAAMLSGELASKRSQLAAEVDRYMPLIYARHLLKEAVSRFEKENQPEMIATVSRLLGQMTEGRYVEFHRTGGGKQNILVRSSDGVERTPDQLSTGTREQLYLAIRLAYVLYYCKRNQPLPIVIDDVLVNFDEKRSRQTLAVLADISQSAQVLFFTCHPHMVKLAREIVPGLNPIELLGNS